MIAGAIEIQMMADLARLKKDMDDAKSVVGNAAQSMQTAANLVKTAFGALGVGLSIVGITNMVKGIIDAAEALHDLSISTGASVESLSAMQAIGRTTGTSIETIGNAMNKMAKNMLVANEESKGTAQAIKALGINFQSFMSMTPDQKMVTVAKAMNQFEDGSGKSAVAMTLMGKEGAKLLPFMKDLANGGELVATTTTKQAEAADKYNDLLEEGRIRVDNLKRDLVLGLVPALTDMHGMSREFGRVLSEYVAGGASDAKGQFEGMALIIKVVGTVMETMLVLGANVAFVLKGIGTEIGGLAAQAVAFLSGNFAGASEIGRQMTADAAKAREELDKYTASILTVTDKTLQARAALNGAAVSAADNAREVTRMNEAAGLASKRQLKFAAATDEASKAAKKHADELAKLAEAGAKLVTGALYTDAGLNADFGDKLTQLAAAYNAKKISMEELEAAQARLMAQQPGVIASLKAATDEAKARADARRKESDEIESYMANQEAQRVQTVKAARDAVTSAQLEYDSYGLLKSQIAELALQRLIDKQNAYTAGSANYESVQKEIDAQKELIGILQRGEVRDASVKAAKEAQDTWLNTISNIGSGMADSLMSGADSFKDYLKNLFKHFLIRVPLQAVMTGITGAVGGALGFAPGMASAADGAGGGGGMLSMLGSVGGSLGALGSFGMTGLMSTLTGTGLGTSLGAAGSLISGGSVAGGIGMGLGAIAPYALAAMLVYKLLTADHDAKLGYGTATMGAGGGIGTGGRLLSFGRGADQGSQGQLEQVAQAVMAGISGTALGLGGSAGAGLAVQASTDMDLSGLGAASINLFRSGVRLGGLQTGGSNPLNSDAAKVDQKDIAAWLADNASAAIVLGLQQSDLPAKFRDFFATVDAFALSKAEAEAMLEAANNARRLTDALTPIGGIFATLGNLSVVATTQLAAMVGGMDALIAKSQDFVKNYYSESEQAAISARNILAAAAKSGAGAGSLDALGGLTDKASFRALFEGIDPNAAGGLGLAALGLNIQAEFAQLSTYLQSSGLTLGQLAAQAMVPAIVTAVSDAADAAAATAAAEADPLAATADAAAGAAGASAGGASATPADLLQSILTSINALAADLKLAATETGTKQAAQTTVTADGFVQSVAVLTAVAEDVHALLRIQQDEAAAV